LARERQKSQRKTLKNCLNVFKVITKFVGIYPINLQNTIIVISHRRGGFAHCHLMLRPLA
jgi:hypothetical protein